MYYVNKNQFLKHRNLKYTSQNKTLFSISFIKNDFLFRFLQSSEISEIEKEIPNNSQNYFLRNLFQSWSNLYDTDSNSTVCVTSLNILSIGNLLIAFRYQCLSIDKPIHRFSIWIDRNWMVNLIISSRWNWIHH